MLKTNRKTFTKIRKWAEKSGYEVVDSNYFEEIRVVINEDLAFEIANRESTIYTSIRGKKGNPKGIYLSKNGGYSFHYTSQTAIIERMENEIISFNHKNKSEVTEVEIEVEIEEKSCDQSFESETLSHLSEDITYFSYYTKRKNRYFFTAWINEVYSHIILEIQDGDISLEFTGEPNKDVTLKAGQQELILEACKNELRKRKVKAFLEMEEENVEDKTIVEIKEGKAIAHVPFDLGKVSKDKVSEDGKQVTIAVGMNTKNMTDYFARALHERAEHIDFDEFQELLDTYFNTRLLNTIGVEEAPLQRNYKGEIEGLREGIILKDYTKKG